MQIGPINTSSALRLIQPIRPAQPVQPNPQVSEVTPVQRDGDTYNFESIYRSKLPRVQFPEAFKRLEQVRSELVAAQVDQPIHFEQAVAVNQSNNPYANNYLKLAPQPCDVNESATRLQAGQG